MGVKERYINRKREELGMDDNFVGVKERYKKRKNENNVAKIPMTETKIRENVADRTRNLFEKYYNAPDLNNKKVKMAIQEMKEFVNNNVANTNNKPIKNMTIQEMKNYNNIKTDENTPVSFERALNKTSDMENYQNIIKNNNIDKDASVKDMFNNYMNEVNAKQGIKDIQEGKVEETKIPKIVSYEEARKREALSNITEYMGELAEEHPILASTLAIEMGPLKGMGAVESIKQKLDGEEIEVNTDANSLANSQKAIIDTVSGKAGKVGSFLYGTGMSMANFLGSLALSGGNPALSLGLMSSGAGTDTIIDAKERGLSDEQALALGAVAAGAEAITEKYSIDKLFNTDDMGLKYLLGNIAAEAEEEGVSSTINFAADTLISGDKSEWDTIANAYMEAGYNEREALNKALRDKTKSIGLDALGGALSGGVMAGGNMAINNMPEYEKKYEEKREQKKAEKLEQKLIKEQQKKNNQKLKQAKDEKTQKIEPVLDIKTREDNLIKAMNNATTKEELDNIYNTADADIKDAADLYYSYRLNRLNDTVLNSNETQEVKNETTLNENETIEVKNDPKEVKNDLNKLNNIQNENKDDDIKGKYYELQLPKKSNQVNNQKNIKPITKTVTNKKSEPIKNVSEENKKYIVDLDKDRNSGNRHEQRIELVKRKIYEGKLNNAQYKMFANEFSKEFEEVTGEKIQGRKESNRVESVKNIIAKQKIEQNTTESTTEIAANMQELNPVNISEEVQMQLRESANYESDEANDHYVAGYDNKMPLSAYKRWYNNFYAAGMRDMDFEKATVKYNARYGNYETAYKAWEDGKNQAIENAKITMSTEQRKAISMYKEVLGREVEVVDDIKGANGMYKDGKIYISSKSSNTGLTVLAHELTHNIKDTSPELYKEYENTVIDYMKTNYPSEYNDVSENLKRMYNTDSMDEINEEIVANASEKFLYDEAAVKELCLNNKTLGEKVVEFFREIIAKIRNLVKNYKETSMEAKMLNADLEVYTKARDIWVKALKENDGSKDNVSSITSEDNEYINKFESIVGRKPKVNEMAYTDADLDMYFLTGKFPEIKENKVVINKYGEEITFNITNAKSQERAEKAKEILTELSNEYDTYLTSVGTGAKKASGSVDEFDGTMLLNNFKPDTYMHEFAHALTTNERVKSGRADDREIEFIDELKKIRKSYRAELYGNPKKGIPANPAINISAYADDSIDEFFAESFTQAKMVEMGMELPFKFGSNTKYSKQVLELTNKYFKKQPIENNKSSIKFSKKVYNPIDGKTYRTVDLDKKTYAICMSAIRTHGADYKDFRGISYISLFSQDIDAKIAYIEHEYGYYDIIDVCEIEEGTNNARDKREIDNQIETVKSGGEFNIIDNIARSDKEEQAGPTGLLGEKQRNGSDENFSGSISDETSQWTSGRISSERGRFSLKDTPFSDIDNWLVENAGETVESVKEVTEILEKGFAQLKYKRVNKDDVLKIARKLKIEYASEHDLDEFTDNLVKVFSYLQSTNKANYDDMLAITAEVARPVIEKSKNIDEEVALEFKKIKKYIKDLPISLTETQKRELDSYYDKKKTGNTGYEQFRRANMGVLMLTDKGTNIETLWPEICARAGSGLDIDENSNRMIEALADFAKNLNVVPVNVEGMNMDKASYDLALRIYEEYFRTYLFIKQNERLKIRNDEWRRKIKADYERKLEKIEKEDKVKRKKLEERLKRHYEREYNVVRVKEKIEHAIQKQKATDKETLDKRTKNIKDSATRRELKRKIYKNVKDMANRINHPTDKAYIPTILKTPVLKLMATVDIVSEKYTGDSDYAVKWRENMQEIQNAFNRLEKDSDEGNDILMSIDPDFKNRLSDFLESTKYLNVSDTMSIDELSELEYLIKTLKHCVNHINKLHNNEQYKHVAAAASNTIRELSNKKDADERKFQAIRKQIDMNMLDPFSYFEMMGESSYSIFMELRDGFDKKILSAEIAQNYIDDLLKDIDTSTWFGNKAKVYDFNGTKMTTGQLMSLYMLVKRPQARHHIERGGVKISKQNIKKGKVGHDSKTVHFTIDQLWDMFDQLTPRQKEVAEKIQKFMATECAKWGNEVSQEMYGYDKFTEEEYFPIETDDNTNKTSDKNAESGNGDNASLYAIRNQGMTKALTKGARNPIVIRDILDVFTKHTTNMANYRAYAIPLTDTMKWYNYKEIEHNEATNTDTTYSIKKSIERAYGPEAKRYFIKFIKDINGEVSNSGLDVMDKLISNYKAASVGANMRVVVQQFTSFVRAANVMDSKYLLAALKKKPATEKALKYSPIAKWKSWGYYETNIGKSMKEVITGQQSTVEKIKDKSMILAQKADEVTWGTLWNACEAEISDKYKDIKYNSAEYNNLVSKRFRDVIDETQVVDSTLHRSQLLRSKDSLVKVNMSFMAEPTKSFNLLGRAIRTGDKKEIAKAIWLFVLQSFMTAATASVVDMLRNTDDEEFGKKYLEALKDNTLSNVNPLNMLPITKDVVSMIEGFDPQRTELEGLGQVIQTGKKIIKLYENKDKYSPDKFKAELYNTLRYSVRAASYCTGVPFFNAWRTIESTYNTFADDNLGAYYTDGQKVVRALEKGEDVKKIIDEAMENGAEKSTIKAAVTRRYKEEYINGTADERVEIKKKLHKTGLYGSSYEISKTCNDWVKSANE